jgi:DNA-binding Xre family transcriptional regulator
MEMRMRLSELLSERNLSPYAVAKADDRISLSALYRLRKSKGRARYFDTTLLEALCEVFGVGPGELLERDKPKRK